MKKSVHNSAIDGHLQICREDAHHNGRMVVWGLIFLTCYLLPLSTNAATKPTNNLGIVGWWPMNEGTSTVAHDISGYGNNGALTNMDSNTDWISGKRGKALDFDGSNDYVLIADNPALDLSNTFSISMWIYLRSSASKGFILKGDNTVSGASLAYGWSSNGFQFIGWNSCNAPAAPVSANDLNQWHHLVGTVGADGTRSLYIDGVLTGTPTNCGTSSWNNVQNLSIGANSVNGYYGNAQIDDVRIYNRVLGASEVVSLRQIGQVTRQTVSQSGLVGWWTFDEGTSTTAHDFSGQGNTGSLSGTAGPTWVSGERGKALNFAGQDTNNNQTVTITAGATNPELAILGDMTVSAWIRPSSSYFDTAQVVIRAGQGADENYSIFFNPASQNHSMQWYDGAFKSVGGTSNTVPFGQWSHVTVVRSGLTANFYVNGIFINSGVVTAPTPAAAQIAIGRTNNVAVPQDFSGTIDDVRVYNRALSASEVYDLARQNQTEIGGSRETSVSDGLVGYWSMNGKDIDWRSQTVYDRSGSNNSGVTVNMSTTTSPALGRVGQSLSFDGANDYVITNSRAITGAASFSVAGWVKFDRTSSTYEVPIWNGVDSTTAGFGLGYRKPNSQVLYAGWGSSNGEVSGPISQNALWYHVASTYDGSIHAFYVNGVSQGTASYSSSNFSSGVTTFGNLTSGSTYWHRGSIDEVRVYNRALSASEVKRLYNIGR